MGMLICPVCRAELFREGNSLRCERGHSYDIARSGYVNLLPPGRKSNSRSGDPDDMVSARRKFLAGGYYDRYVRETAAVCAETLSGECENMIDAACGEGHHSLILADILKPRLLVGLDASKKAADSAAKAAKALSGDHGEIFFAAGNIFSMPVADRSCDLVTVLFAPIPFGESLRVLRPGGVLCTAGAGADHLIELRELIYDEVRIKNPDDGVFDGFSSARRENIKYKAELDRDSLRALFAMTPFCRRASEEGVRRVESAEGLCVTVSIDCRTYRKEKENENFSLHTDV